MPSVVCTQLSACITARVLWVRFLAIWDTLSAVTTYARRLGLFSATMAVAGGIIGGGIFRTPATVAQRVGSTRLVLIAWGLGGVIALIGAFCFGELGARRPKARGGHAEHVHGLEARRPRRLDRRCPVRRLPVRQSDRPTVRRTGGRAAGLAEHRCHARGSISPHPLHLRRLAADQLHRRGDRRAGAEPAAGAGAGRRD